MDKDSLRALCLSFPFATEDVQWGNDLLFRVAGKIFAGTNLEPAEIRSISFKCTPEKFAELIEREGIVPAPYMARYHWVSVSNLGALKARELPALLRESYDMVYGKLPAGTRKKLEGVTSDE